MEILLKNPCLPLEEIYFHEGILAPDPRVICILQERIIRLELLQDSAQLKEKDWQSSLWVKHGKLFNDR